MLGKTAGGIYWLFRYLERAENIARLVETGHRFTLTRGSGSASEWRSIVKALGMDAAYVARHGEYESGHVVDFLLRDKGNEASLRAVIDLARQNARLTRTAITREVWEAVNESWINVNDALKRPVREAELPNILEMIKRDSAMVRGARHRRLRAALQAARRQLGRGPRRCASGRAARHAYRSRATGRGHPPCCVAGVLGWRTCRRDAGDAVRCATGARRRRSARAAERELLDVSSHHDECGHACRVTRLFARRVTN